MQLFRGADAGGRGTSPILVMVAVTGLTTWLPSRAAPQATAIADPHGLEWQSTAHPQLLPERPELTPTQRSAVRWGGRIGGVVGLATGVILSVRHDCVEEECLVAPAAAGLTIAFGTALGTVSGMGVGLVVGSVIDGSRESRLRLGFAVGVGS